jgi:FMN-dependent NADH-azoreductase
MKLLYVRCNPKPESQSACLRVGREFVRHYMLRYPEHEVEELDLYGTNLPEVDATVFSGQATLAGGGDYENLDFDAQNKVDRINELCTQFLSADRLVLAAPMWSMTFPPRLKAWLDCVVLNGRALRVRPDHVEGLLDDSTRRAVFIQSCGGVYTGFFASRFNYGAVYLKNLLLFLGYDDFIRLAVDGTGRPDIGYECAVSRAVNRIDSVLDDLT